jgi:type IV pilus assembly protein PilX
MKTDFEHRQGGAALIVALFMLLIMTLMGLSSMRTILQEERMTGNTFDRSLAFQAAEAALRAGEIEALAQSKASPPNSNFPGGSGLYIDADATACPANYFTNTAYCNNGLCKQADPNCAPRWETSTFNAWRNATGLSLTATVGTPQFFIEYLGGTYPCDPTQPTNNLNCSRYRVTARSVADGRAAVILQSIYATE